MTSSIVQLAVADDCLRLVQISDTHLREDEGGTLVGLDTDFSLSHVTAIVRSERENIDLMLGTGDISDHGSERAYERALKYFGGFDAPILWLVGNHDDANVMARVLGRDNQLAREAQTDHWQVLMLNSQIPGEVGGQLGDAELEWLQARLEHAREQGLHSLVCLHHQPVAMGSAWIDEQMVSDSSVFFDIVDRFEGVRGILWGHVHQQFDRDRNGVALMATPSSCIQFAPGSEGFKVDDQPPGYRWLDLHTDGRIETGVSRVQNVEFSVDLESSGYL
jgi:Icc protein